MKKLILICFVLCVFFNCSKQKSKTLIEFEQIIGEENASLIDTLLFDFENNFLKKRYNDKSISEVYNTFLTEVKDSSNLNWITISEKSKSLFSNSTLNLHLYQYIDSIWIETDTSKLKYSMQNPIKKRWYYLNQDNLKEYHIGNGQLNPRGISMDSILFKEENMRQYNPLGKFHFALFELQSKNNLAGYMFEIKDAVGLQPHYFIADDFLKIDIDYEDELNKRLIMLEFVF